MEKSYLKSATTNVKEFIDIDTGEIIETQIVHNKYLANTKEEFFLMYSSMILIMKASKDVRIQLFAALLERYAQGQEFSVSKGLKELIAKECGCSPRSFDSAISYLVKQNIIVRLSNSLYRINPRHVFRGSSKQRDGALKAVLEIYCPNC